MDAQSQAFLGEKGSTKLNLWYIVRSLLCL